MTDIAHKEHAVNDRQLQTLLSELGSRNGMDRRRAREALVKIGEAATDALSQSLSHHNVTIRWEAAKALGAIADPKAAPALVQSLTDESFEVQWLAAEALIALGEDALVPLLEGLIDEFGSVYMRQGAHHVLHDLERRDLLNPATQKVLEDLRELEPLEPFPISALRALEGMSQSEHSASAVINR